MAFPLYFLAAHLISTRSQTSQNKAVLYLGVSILLFSTLAIFDTLSTYKLTMSLSPPAPGSDINLRIGDILQNIGHFETIMNLLLIPISFALWTKGNVGKVLSLSLWIIVFISAWVTGMNVGLLAASTALLFILLAKINAKLAVRLSFLIAQLGLLLAPLLAYFAKIADPSMKAKLPFSWEERVSSWGYIYDKILQKPIFGHGFDAVRTFSDTHTIRGFENRALVSLHPHNAGLHLWAETGLIGVLLVCLAIYLFLRHLMRCTNISQNQMALIAAFTITIVIISNLSYSVWQDWWWASIVFCASLITYIYKKIQ